jgi:hypothetical protein
VDLLLLAVEARERGEAKGAEAWETLASKERITARLTRGVGCVHPGPHHGERWPAIARQPPGTSVITEQANLEVSHLMRAVLEGEGQGSLTHDRAQDLPPPATIEVCLSRCADLVLAPFVPRPCYSIAVDAQLPRRHVPYPSADLFSACRAGGCSASATAQSAAWTR